MKTFEFQKLLARLPIPTLENTAKTYLESCKPFYSDAKQEQDYSVIVKDFVKPGGLGEKLQSRLQAYDKTQENSWLEKWWLKYAYLSWRNSVLVHSNWFVLAKSPSNAPVEAKFTEGYSAFQVRRAAGFTSSFLDYKDMLDREEIPPEKSKTGYLDMSQLKKMFGITRVPKPECDILVGSHPATAKHIVVLVKDQIFVVDVYDQKTGGRISIEEIEKQFNDCIEIVSNVNLLQPPICLLSGQHRDKWAEHHGHLLEISPKNAQSFDLIETALFAVSLDHRLIASNVTNLAKSVFHGFDGHNRWFDKSLSIVVTSDGRIGVNGEHSPCDALIPALIVDFAARREPPPDPKSFVQYPTLSPVHRLKWEIDETIAKAFSEAQAAIFATIADSDLEVLHYNKYGSDFIKKIAKVSPDAFSQLCLQLTFYRIHGYCAGVYETASTRAFLVGRTETCRSLTPAAKKFVTSFDTSLSPAQKYANFQAAAKAHVNFIVQASNGMGVDRHLLGLKMCMEEGESHPIYTHPIFAKSSKWQLSTSALIAPEYLDATGFGTVYPDGYGMNYMLGPKAIHIGVESKFSCLETSTKRFISTLQKVYDDMREMCEVGGGSTSAKL